MGKIVVFKAHKVIIQLNIKLKRFQQSIEEGHILLMVDVAKDRVDEIRSIIHQHFPESENYGEDHAIPAFP